MGSPEEVTRFQVVTVFKYTFSLVSLFHRFLSMKAPAGAIIEEKALVVGPSLGLGGDQVPFPLPAILPTSPAAFMHCCHHSLVSTLAEATPTVWVLLTSTQPPPPETHTQIHWQGGCALCRFAWRKVNRHWTLGKLFYFRNI